MNNNHHFECQKMKFFIGEKLTIADFDLGALFFSFFLNEDFRDYKEFNEIFKKYKTLVRYTDNLKESFKDYIEKRPKVQKAK
jgi:glutathione S-transferase